MALHPPPLGVYPVLISTWRHALERLLARVASGSATATSFGDLLPTCTWWRKQRSSGRFAGLAGLVG